jgi:hypothetical protein
MKGPGNIPSIWGTYEHPVGGIVECLNFMNGMLAFSTYYFHFTNMVFAGEMACTASKHELSTKMPYIPHKKHTIYLVTPQGLPHTPHKARKLIDIICDSRPKLAQCIEAYFLILNLYSISNWVIDRYCDRTMHWLHDSLGFDTIKDVPPVSEEDLNPPGPICNFTHITNSNNAINVTTPEEHALLNIDNHAQFLLCHSFLGSGSYTHGIIIDHILRVKRHSVFGYGLSQLLVRANKGTWSSFV